VTLLTLKVGTLSEHESAFTAMAQMHADVLVDILDRADSSNSATTERVLQLALKHRLPAIYQTRILWLKAA
jgi:hypothetical protein